MSPLRCIHGTISHWTVILEEVTADILTESGAADGAGVKTKALTDVSREMLAYLLGGWLL